MAISISSALSRQCAAPSCRLPAATMINGAALCPGHTAAVRGRLVLMRIPLNDFRGNVLELLRTEYTAPSYSTPAERFRAGALQPGRMAAHTPAPPTTDPASECECRHSLGAHVRGAEHECSFCSCTGFQQWINPDTVTEKPLYRDVSEALGRLAHQPGFRDLASEHLMALGRYGHRRFFADKSILFDQGDDSDCVYLLLSGSVQAEFPASGRLGERRVRFEPGEILGTQSFLRGTRHLSTLRAVDDVYVLELTKKEVADSFRHNPNFGIAFMRMIQARTSARTTVESASKPAA